MPLLVLPDDEVDEVDDEDEDAPPPEPPAPLEPVPALSPQPGPNAAKNKETKPKPMDPRCTFRMEPRLTALEGAHKNKRTKPRAKPARGGSGTKISFRSGSHS